jgi:hypothetical protein
MHFLFDDGCGRTHRVDDSRSMLKAMGVRSDALPIIMTDESGAIVGAGFGGAELTRSVPLIKAMRESQPLVKKPVVFKKSETMRKSMSSHGATSFDSLLDELASIPRSFV